MENFDLNQEYTGGLINIIVKVPENTVACKFTAKMLQDGKLQDAHMEMDAEAFRQARKDFLDEVDGGDEYDKVYALTEEGRKYVDKLLGVDE